MSDRTKDFASLLVSRAAPDTLGQVPVALPICQSTTFVLDDAMNAAMEAGDYRGGWLYTRMGNPTVAALEERLAALHQGEAAVATASGMGALSAALFALTSPGDTVLVDTQLYGVTDSLLRRYLEPAGRRIVREDFRDLPAVTRRLEEGVQWMLGETVANPLLQVLPIASLAERAHAHGARLMVDNTFANPLLCRPLELGAHVVIESLSKSIAGHSDVHGGAVVADRAVVTEVWEAMLHLGACLDPHAAAMIFRGMKTLAMRTQVSGANTAYLSERLRAMDGVLRVHAAEGGCGVLMGTCPMLAFELEGGDARAQRWLDALQLIVPATSLGGVESLACLPMNTSHRSAEARARTGLQPGTVRLSVGCEDADALAQDIAQAVVASA